MFAAERHQEAKTTQKWGPLKDSAGGNVPLPALSRDKLWTPVYVGKDISPPRVGAHGRKRSTSPLPALSRQPIAYAYCQLCWLVPSTCRGRT